MSMDQIKIDIEDLTTGMYVSRLDRPWIETPFPLQGYYIKELSDISALRQYCKHVYIDIRRGKSPVDPVFLQTLDSSFSNGITNKSVKGVKSRKLKTKKGFYKYATSPRKEVKNAHKMKELAELAISYIDGALASHKKFPVKETKKVVSLMVQNIIKNPDAFIWLNKIKDKDSHLYGHTVRTTIWAISLGRHLGVSVDALNNLALGIMISEIGKTKLPDSLLEKSQADFSLEELELYQTHVMHAMEILNETDGMNNHVLGVVASMHERHDGSGYPQGLIGDQIPYLAKLAGISGYYDEITFPRNEEFGLSPTDGIAQIYRMINQEFQKDLVEEFIQATGIYPAGTLVELSTSETAMVIEQNPERRLRPKVLLLLDAEKNRYKRFKLLDLMKKVKTVDGRYLEIAYSLPIGSYGADPSSIYDTAFTSKWSFSKAS